MMARIATVVVVILGMGLGVGFGGQPSRPAAPKPTEILQGEIVELKVSGRGLTSVEGWMGKERIYFHPNEAGFYAALVGADVEAKPGPAKVAVKGVTQSGARWEIVIPLKIKAKAFKTESFSVAEEFDQLGAETLERIRREQEQLAQIFSSSAPRRFWEGPFLTPVPRDITSPFGYRRVINETPRSPHTGVDLKAASGTEVLAANHGRVVLVGDFFYSGKSLVLDHGCGLHTMYFHLSEFKADAGMEVRRGEVVARTGMTGRVTGPHVHWGARMNGARIDPLELVDKLGAKGETLQRAEIRIERLVK